MILEAIKERRSVREYDAKDVTEETVREVIRAGQYAPTGMNSRAVEFVVVRDAAVKDRLFGHLEPQQAFVKNAPVLIVPTLDTRKSPVAIPDLSIATSFMMLQAAALGLGTVWKHVQPGKEGGLRRILGLPQEYAVLNIIPLGYPAKKMPPHQESEFAVQKVHAEKWQAN